MGYRSDVKYVIVFPSVEKRDEFLVKQKMLESDETKKAINELEILEGKPVVRFHEVDTKWYDDYPDVKAHHALMKLAVDEFGGAYYFVRIGEDLYDIEELEKSANGELWAGDYIYIERSSGFNDP